jgi:outer membrane protein assembly factor BamB
MYCHDVKHTGRSPHSTANNSGGVKWFFQTDFSVHSSPAIDKNGTIYIGCVDGRVYALNPDGAKKWSMSTNDVVTSSPAIAEDGTIYVGSWDDYLYAINPNGTRKWRFYARDTVTSSPAIAEDGTIYFGVVGPEWDKGRIYAINPNGTEKWHYDTGYYVFTSPAIGDDGTIYITSNDCNLYAFYPNGTVNWTFKMGDLPGAPAIADDGTIYVPSWDGNLYAIFPNSTLKWKSGIGWGSGHTPSIAPDGTIYIGDDELYAINPDGTRKWTFNPGKYIDVTSKSHAISADGTIYIGVSYYDGRGGYIIAVNSDGTEKWRHWIHNEAVWSAPSIGTDGTVYVGTSWNHFGRLYAIGGVKIQHPEPGMLYVCGKEIIPTPKGNTVILGSITIRADAYDRANVSKVEFYVDDVKQHEDTGPPYEWTWNEHAFFKHILKVKAYYIQGHNSTDEMTVWKFF